VDESHERVIQALASTPPKHLKIIALAWDVLDEHGTLDPEVATERAPEINLALAEAKTYAKATARALQALTVLPARVTPHDR
jgi:hypothetical protein